MIRIALDAMGGDHAPRVEVEGVAQALGELPATFLIQLVGRTADIEAALQQHPEIDRARLQIVEAPEVVGMGEKPLAALRGKPKSSIAVGLGLQKKDLSDAFISAGNTGAVMAASTLILRLHPGVQRAAIGALLPTGKEPVLLLDAGANVDCDARELGDGPLHATASPRANSSPMSWLRWLSTDWMATRIAFLMARAGEEPWQMIETPWTPSSGAPP